MRTIYFKTITSSTLILGSKFNTSANQVASAMKSGTGRDSMVLNKSEESTEVERIKWSTAIPDEDIEAILLDETKLDSVEVGSL